MCGSLGSRQLGQAMSWGAVAFHWARRDLVLLRDIFRFGTATSLLLITSEVLQCRPHRAPALVAVTWLGVGKPHTALHAQPRTAILAAGRERQLQHDRVTQRRFQVQQTAGLEPVAIRA